MTMNKNRNFVIESVISTALRLRDNATAEKLDAMTRARISRLDYMVIFLNDQLYNYSIMLEDLLKEGGLMKFEQKFHFKKIKEAIQQYNSKIEKMDPQFIELVADVTSSMEEDIQPHIDMYKYQMSQLLLDNGVSGNTNHILSIIEVMLLMRCMIDSSIKFIKELYYNCTMIDDSHYTDFLEIRNIDAHLRNLSDMVVAKCVGKKAKVDFSNNEKVAMAFEALKNKLFDAKVYNKAFENWS